MEPQSVLQMKDGTMLTFKPTGNEILLTIQFSKHHQQYSNATQIFYFKLQVPVTAFLVHVLHTS